MKPTVTSTSLTFHMSVDDALRFQLQPQVARPLPLLPLCQRRTVHLARPQRCGRVVRVHARAEVIL